MNQITTQEQREEIRELNAMAMAGCSHEGASVTRDMHELGHQSEKLFKHDVTGFDKLLDGQHGLNMKGRVLYNLNFIAQRICREALRDALSEHNDPISTALEGLLSDEELSEMFGFETKPVYTLDKALHWTMITYIATHDITQYTESDRYGMKVRPFAWMTELIRNPFSMVAHDMQFSIKSATDQQAIQMEKFGYRAGAAASLEKFKAQQTARAEEHVKSKIELIKQTMTDLHTYKRMGTEELTSELLEMIADLGISIPILMREIADKYKEGLMTKADEGKYLGEVDEQILFFCTPEKTKPASKAVVEAEDKAEPAPASAKPAKKGMTRVKREDAIH